MLYQCHIFIYTCMHSCQELYLHFHFISDDLEHGDTDLHALLPADPEVTTGEEAGHSMSPQVVDPALLSQLGHDCIYEGVTCLTLQPS